jgi:glycosyltransferase involved in cell wall biosynthesis
MAAAKSLDLSVVILTLDAGEVLEGALASVPPGAEVVVAEGGSRDQTRELAERHGARLVEQDLRAVEVGAGNFDLARNAAGEAARRPWLLFLDADERISHPLSRELAALLAGEPRHCGYRIPRVNLFWGRSVRLLGDDLQLRLVRRGAGRFEGSRLHQPMQVAGSVGRLEAPLVHLNVRSWSDVRRRWRRDVPLEARALEPRPGLRAALGSPLHLFRYYFFTQGAWRDGARGLLVSLLYAARHAAILWHRRGHRA